MLDDAGVAREARGEGARIVERLCKVRDHAAVGTGRDVTKGHRAEAGERSGETEVVELERDGRSEGVDELVRRHDHDEPICRCSDCLLARVRAATALDEPPVGRDLVGTVDRDVEASERCRSRKRLDGEAELARGRLRRRRGRDAPKLEASRRQGREQERDGRPGAEPDGHAVLHELRRGLGGEPLLASEPHRGGRYPETTVEHSPERELKLTAGPDFRMPSIYGLGGATVRNAPPERNATTYYDTDDLRLARWGASLRHRPGEGWTVKLPAERAAPFLVRPEIVFEGNGGNPPAAAIQLVRGFVRDRDVHERVRMTTIRRRTGIHDSGGRLMGGVVDDAVSVLDDGNPPSSFRELEVEIGDEMTPTLLDSLVERLRQAGAGASPDQTAKYTRALAAHVPLTPEVTVADLGGDATAAEVVTRAIALSVIRLILHDPIVRLDVDPEGVHQARVATRRLRSDLRTFRSLIEPSFANRLRDELGWLAALLGEVRDGDVLLARLRGKVAELPGDEQSGAATVLAALEETRGASHRRLLETLESDRYVALLSQLVGAASAPELRSGADASAAEVVPALVRRPWHKLQKVVGSLPESPSDEQLHEVRIRTKRARYAAEAAAPVVGKPARAFARAAAGLQEVLGDLNDAVVAAAWLDRWPAAERTKESMHAAVALAAAERVTASSLRTGWVAAWERLEAPELRSWM